eukprot:394460_1
MPKHKYSVCTVPFFISVNNKIMTTIKRPKMKGSIRKMVSKKKRRFVQPYGHLDLSYLTKSIIRMGFPVQRNESLNESVIYGNDIDEIIVFLNQYHHSKYMIYNLCSKQEQIYNHSKFNNQVTIFPINKYECPQFNALQLFCESLDEYLCSKNKQHDAIAVFHDNNDYGRAGIVICCYLLHIAMMDTAQHAIRYYKLCFRPSKPNIMNMPSQCRWINYYEKLMKLRITGQSIPKTKLYKITKITLSANTPNINECIIFNNNKMFNIGIQNKSMRNKSFQKALDIIPEIE